jgi:Cu(I)/Ag(I) efflux system membrane fusion protein
VDPTVAHNFGVRLAEVERAVLDDPIFTLGNVALAEPLISHVHPRVSGWIERLAVDAENDPVTEGEVLLELYSPELVRAQEEFLVALRRDATELVAASRARLRALGMRPDQVAALERSGEVLERIAIRAERDGFVLALNVREGMYVQPSTEVMAVGTLDQVWVLAELFERQIPRLAEDREVRFTLDFVPGREWRGEIDLIEPQLDAQLRTLGVRMRFDNPDGRLRPGMFGRVRLEGATDGPVPVIPREALIRGVGDTPDRVVVALGENRYRSRAVRIGRVTADRIEILTGLEVGERIVVSGQFLIDSESDLDAELLRMGATADGDETPDPSRMDHSEMDDSEMDDSEMDDSGMDHSEMDHSGMDHSGMDHSEMDHSEMDHSEMDHSGMDHSGMDHSGMDHSGMDHSEMDHPEGSADGQEASP